MAKIEVERVVPVDPSGKYVLIFPEDVSLSELEMYANDLKEWWESDEPFLGLANGITLQRVDSDGEEENGT